MKCPECGSIYDKDLVWVNEGYPAKKSVTFYACLNCHYTNSKLEEFMPSPGKAVMIWPFKDFKKHIPNGKTFKHVSVPTFRDSDGLDWSSIISERLKNSKNITATEASIREHELGLSQGIKKAEPGKLDWTILPWQPLQDVVKVMQFGAEKHQRDGWKKTQRYEYVHAFMRHAVEYLMGKRVDEESGLPTLAHLVCDVLFVMWHDLYKE